MPSVSLQRRNLGIQEESSDLETLLLELGFLCEDRNVADPDALLEAETFTTVTAYDALNRAISIKTPHNVDIPASEILPSYNEANLLERVDVKLRGSSTSTNFVQNVDYDAKGQRERIQYGNGSTTGYTYDEKTFRLKRLLTTRNNGADILQDLNYTYDAAGNVTQIDDNAQQTIFFNGSVVSPSQKFEYDALYRLVKATGREHVSVNADGEPEAEGYNAAQISPQDGTAMRNYAREWRYDCVGNILSIIHDANGNAWTRTNAYATDSNRLTGTTVGSASASFSYNAHGSIASMPHLNAMDWDFAEKLSHITRGTTEAYYNYDGNGIRTRKVVVKNGVTETRLYLGGFEIWRKSVNGALDTERETLHVMDDQKRIAIVETLTVENGNRVAVPAPVQRYQLDNHLGSASLELDASANVISYEEYYPYGDTSYRAGRNASEVSRKRYRYTGKEKDEESGLYYHGARYYACWLGRWTAADPIGIGDGLNVYMYVRGNPVSGVDPSGTGTENSVDINERKTIENIKTQTDKAKMIVEENEKRMEEYGSYLDLSDEDKQDYLMKSVLEGNQAIFYYAIFEAFEDGFYFLKNPENRGVLKELEDIMNQSLNLKKEPGFISYEGKKYEEIKISEGKNDGFTETVDINGAYEADRQKSNIIYGNHAHFTESAMSFNSSPNFYNPDEPFIRGDIPHVESNELSSGLFMINSEGQIFFVNKNLATFIVKTGIYSYSLESNSDTQELKKTYINQVYIGKIGELKK